MDLYRYFHPHHNPRLRKTPLRLQEVAELQQAAIELTRALKRAHIRMQRVLENNDQENQNPHSSEEILAQAVESGDNLVSQLIELTQLFPDDEQDTMKELLSERRNAPGWETWTQLLEQRLKLEDPDRQPEAIEIKLQKTG